MADNVLVNFLFGGNASGLQSASAQAQSALAKTGDSFVAQRFKFIAATAAITGFAGALIGTVKSLVETSAEFQRLSTSFVSILAGPLLDAKEGAALTIENVKILRAQSAGLFEDSQRAAVDTVATTKEYVSTLQAALAIGQAIGLNQAQIEELVHRLVIAAGQFGIEQEKVGTSIAQIFSGTVRATNQLGRNLGLGTIEARKQLKEAINLGNVYDFLINKTKGFAATSKESADNFINVAASIKDIFQIGGTAAIQPLFEFLRKQLLSIRDEFFGLGADSPALKNLVGGFQNFFKQIVPSIQTLFQSFGDLFDSIGTRSGEIVESTKIFLRLLESIVKLLAEAISLQGLGGFVAGTYLAVKGAQFLNGLWKTIVQYQNLSRAAQAGQALAAVSGRAVAAATATSVGAIGGSIAAGVGDTVAAAATAQAKINLDIARAAVGETAEAVAAANAGIAVAEAGVARLDAAIAQTGISLPAVFAAAPAAKLAEAEAVATEATIAHEAAVDRAVIAEEEYIVAQNAQAASATKVVAAEELVTTATAEEAAVMEADVVVKEQVAVVDAELAAAQAGLLATYGPLVIIAGVLAAAYFLLGENAEEAAARTEKLTIATEAFKTQQDEFAKNSNLEDLITEFQRLSASQDRTYKDSVRLVEITNILKGVFDDATIALIRAGKVSSEVFNKGQIALSDNLQKRIDDLQKLNDAAKGVRDLASTPLVEDTSPAGQSTNDLLKQQQQLLKELAAIYFPQYTEAELATDEVRKKIYDSTLLQIAADKKQKESTDALTKSKEQLFQTAYEVSQQDQTVLENQKKLAQATAALQFLYLQEAKAHGLIGAAATAAAKAAVEADLAKAKTALTTITNLELENDLLIKQLSLFSFARILAKEKGLSLDEQRKLQESTVAQLEALRAAFSAKAPAAAKVAKPKSGRDELSDFIKALEQQLTLLKKINDLIDKEADRTVEHRTKILQSLEESGSIPFEAGLKQEQDLIVRAFSVKDSLAKARQELIDADIQLTKVVADRQSLADQKKAKGRLAPDTRQRDLEAAEKLYSDKLATYVKRVDDLRKIEQEIFDIGQRSAVQRIENRKALLEANAALREDEAKTAAERANALESAGLLSPEAAILKDYESNKTALEERRKEIERTLFPQSDPEFRNELLTATSKIDQLIGTTIDEATFTKLEAAAKKVKELSDELERLNKERSVRIKSGDNAQGITKQIKDLENDLNGITQELKLSVDETRALGDAFAVVNKLNISRAQYLKLIADLKKTGNQLDILELTNQLKIYDAAQDRLKLEEDFVNARLQQLDILDKINQIETSNGTINAARSRQRTVDLEQQRLKLIDIQKLLLESQLGNVRTLTGAFGSTPQSDRRIIDLTNQLNTLGLTAFEVKNKIFDLTNPLVALRDAFKDIEDAVGNLPDPFNKLKGVFKGLEDLLNALANKSRPKPPEVVLQESTDVFKNAVIDFQKAVNQLLTFLQTGKAPGVSGSASSTGLDSIDLHSLEDSGAHSAGQAITKKTKVQIVDIIKAAGSVVAGVLGAIANKDIGQGISALAPLANLIPVAGPFIAAGLEIVGGIVSFFGAAAKKKTQEMAAAITSGINDLKDAISSGAVGLGQGIRDLQAKLEDARRQLSGRKGGSDALKQIEADVAAEQKRLRAEAKKIQDDFAAQLDLLRAPKGLRDTITAINAIADSAKKFISSFENPADALAAVKDAQEFVRLSIQEIKDDIQKTLEGLQQNLRDATDKFATDERAILLEGRINPAVSEAESKRQRLVALEQEFQKNKLDLENQISAEQQKLDYVNQRNKIEEKIARLAQQGADSLGLAADKLTTAATALESAFTKIGTFNFGGGQPAASNPVITLNFKINGADAGSTTVGVGTEQHLEMAGLLSSSRLNRFNPVVR